ncbi:hypothetical protein TWF106_009826 [Orbilia oligospora]|uniref:Ribosomal protein L9 domain-containing protein n=1 Tax=Orbilia oligospora TaxID=2813651 RepID=A0A6G1LPY0_ORBOL|nr:hypothetical protein TWF788_006021 [Orbilia oligospora]KAF3213778.1 hypothetical protein TWF679_005108 [Orbilia oligospora]KAF3219652.1 hypothetical protein TWF191_007633 [Orbilia oligospora]KAF3227307.1 hypothetical protein TWF106_009826 [Orbilia oligospora]KAF3229212.1 hypothetical protein TWF192_005497 [Orbilia oligospora]
MSFPQTLATTLLGSASRASSLLRPTSTSISTLCRTNLSICSSCLLSLSKPGPTTFIRGKKKLVKKAAGIKVRFLKDIPRYGPKGSIMIVAPGRMRTIWYQRGEAEYLTLEKEKALGKHTVVERDPGYTPFVEKVEEKTDSWDGVVKDQLLTPVESIKILSTILPSTIRFYRSTITPQTSSLHGSVTTTDIVNAVKLICSASALKDANRVVISAENINLGTDDGAVRVKELGEYQIAIGFRGVDEIVRRTITVVREEGEEDEGQQGQQESKGTVVSGGGGSLFGGEERRAEL